MPSLSAGELLVAESGFAIRLASAIAFAILFYDYALTFWMEVERFWARGRPTVVSSCFFLNRYLALLGHVPVMVEFYASHDQSVLLQMYHQIFSGVIQVIVGLLQLLRTYALYSGDRGVLAFLLSFVAAGCVISGWAVSKSWGARATTLFDRDPALVARFGCDLRMSQTEGIYLAGVWATVLVFDLVVFGLTVFRVLRVGKKWRGSMFTLMLKDGAVYFAALFVCHLMNILTCLLADSVYRGISVTTTNVIATSLISRLMLNIRDPEVREKPFCWPSDVDFSGV